ncbi:AbrB/MazE/SpoVT family DNA-binding domain-containing protein [Lacticaseibacillus rhamnosus]|uniref:AbrB/MazE/SpoVT family DNA-binding domain-containing protein n=1 Tax=Lacticaseibacillus rhamnosus TaxID=47715 RepID=UPI002915C575|nr:AbrB/MazE/SpoVT family DNA-binding domain-containing protein [Lacticaseibacillus rhamnosus]WNX04802.1 AbrB/MazE/SpoVT family DNA-binding domain-containing protein [Lacticaseibacillus rhamnosus]WNX12722.1 AbrB/MazE/SpoVT family DNA-binding domain-containing protein [Lacticaseibacillus rhamnosus]
MGKAYYENTFRVFHHSLTSKGQVTIPAEIRRRSGIKKNTKVRFNMMEDGTVQMRVIKRCKMEGKEELITTIQDLMDKYKTGIDYLKDK